MGLDYKYAFGKRWSRGNGLLPPDKDFLAIKAIKDQQAAGSCDGAGLKAVTSRHSACGIIDGPNNRNLQTS